MHAGLTSALFLKSLAIALAIVLVVTVPVIRTLIGRGKWHAMCTSTTTEPARRPTGRGAVTARHGIRRPWPHAGVGFSAPWRDNASAAVCSAR
jgi:hypothetical protein